MCVISFYFSYLSPYIYTLTQILFKQVTFTFPDVISSHNIFSSSTILEYVLQPCSNLYIVYRNNGVCCMVKVKQSIINSHCWIYIRLYITILYNKVSKYCTWIPVKIILDIAAAMQPRHAPTPTHSPTHTQAVCVFPLHTFIPISCFLLYCNWKASEGFLRNMTTQRG